MIYKVYVLYSEQFKRSYVGFSEDVSARLIKHNKGLVISTRKHKPWKLVYEEVCDDYGHAVKWEKYYKSSAGRRRLKGIFADLGINK